MPAKILVRYFSACLIGESKWAANKGRANADWATRLASNVVGSASNKECRNQGQDCKDEVKTRWCKLGFWHFGGFILNSSPCKS